MNAVNSRFIGALLAAAFFVCSPASAASPVSAELEAMYKADQKARKPVPGKQVDWPTLMAEDGKRLKRVRELVANGSLSTGQDFANAAMLFQNGGTALDALMAHDLAVIALIKGVGTTKWLAAASLDRYLRGVGNPQRFGTQLAAVGGGKMQLEAVDPKVPDSLRRAFGVPALARSAPPNPDQAAQDPAAAQEIVQMISSADADLKTLTTGKPGVDWTAIDSRAQARRERVRTLLEKDQLRTAKEFYHAAMMMLNSPEPDDVLTAHDLAVVAISKGEARAAQVAAESLDRFLMRTGRQQRYATQIEIANQNPPRIYPVDPAVSDFLRNQYGVPTLAAAQQHEAKLRAGYGKH